MPDIRDEMPDEDLGHELAAQRTLTSAIDLFRRAIVFVNSNSSLIHMDPGAFEAYVQDECPSIDAWDQQISERRRWY